MSTATRLLGDSTPTKSRHREPMSARLMSLILAAGMIFYLVANWHSLFGAFQFQAAELIFWTVLIVAVNFLPLNLGEITVTLDMPILVAISLLYPPPVAALIGVVAAVDIREFERRVSFLRAIFNRAQIGFSVLGASFAFQEIAGGMQSNRLLVLGTLAAILTFHVTNIALVVIHAWLRTRRWNSLSAGAPVQFLVTYLGYGVLAVVLSRLFTDVGAWSVVIFLIPIAVARVALLRAQRLQFLTQELTQKEQQLQRNLGQIVDERKDERVRIGAELHDDVLQSLIRISQLGRFIRKEIGAGSQASTDASELVSVAEGAIKDLRHVVADLRTSPVGLKGLVPTLKSLSKDVQLQSRVPVRVQATGELDLTGEEQLVLYQVAKEAITNAVKHADPATVSVRIGERGSSVFLEVRDDGRGFNVEGVDERTTFGLGLIRERVKRHHGQLNVQSKPGSGTSLSVLIPRESGPDSPRSDGT